MTDESTCANIPGSRLDEKSNWTNKEEAGRQQREQLELFTFLLCGIDEIPGEI